MFSPSSGPRARASPPIGSAGGEKSLLPQAKRDLHRMGNP